MKRDGLAARLSLLAAFGAALVLPRETMPCCKGGTCCPIIARAAEQHSCCQSPQQVAQSHPAHPAPADSDRDPSPLGGLGCGSPCCTKAPAPTREPLALGLDDSGLIPSFPALDPPPQPQAGGVFHPPRS